MSVLEDIVQLFVAFVVAVVMLQLIVELLPIITSTELGRDLVDSIAQGLLIGGMILAFFILLSFVLDQQS